MSDFVTKDSGKREEFTSGMVRDTADDKPNYALVYDGPMLTRWGGLLTRGAVKYAKRNWMKASGQAELERFQESAARHFAQWMRGETDEDHAAAVFFNMNGAEYVRERQIEELRARVDTASGSIGYCVPDLTTQTFQANNRLPHNGSSTPCDFDDYVHGCTCQDCTAYIDRLNLS